MRDNLAQRFLLGKKNSKRLDHYILAVGVALYSIQSLSMCINRAYYFALAAVLILAVISSLKPLNISPAFV